MQFVALDDLRANALLGRSSIGWRAQREMCVYTSATKNRFGRFDLIYEWQIATEVTENTERESFGHTSVILRVLGGQFRISVGRRSIASAARASRRTRKKDLDVGAPLWVPRPILDCGKKGFLASGERHSEPRRRGTTPTSCEQARLVRSTLPPSPGPPVEAALPIRHTAMTNLPSSARVSRERAINGGQGRDAGTYATSAPRAKKNPRRTLTSRSACNSTNLRCPVRIG